MSLAELFYAKHPRGPRVAYPGRRASRRRAKRLLFEPLEPRLLLSSQPLSLAAGVAADLTLRLVDDVGRATLELVDNAAATPGLQVLARQALVDTSAVKVEGSDDADRLVIDDSVPVELAVTFTGRHGLDKLLGRNAQGLWRITSRDAGQVDSVIVFSEVEQLTGGGGADIFVVAVGASLSGVLDGGAGSDTLVGGDTDNAWILGGADAGTLNDLSFRGVENVTGGTGADTFVVTLEASLDGVLDGGAGSDTLVGADTENTWTITEANAGTLEDLSFVSIENLTGGAGEDTFAFVAGGSLDGVIAGGAGIDTLQGADTPNTWRLTGAGAGTLSGQSFVEIENLVGGADTDLFVFAGGSVSGTIDGGAGENIFDYSDHASDVTVDLGTGAATATDGIANVSSVIGGAGSDTLAGADSDNTWTVTGPDVGTVGTVSFSGVENLAGGTLGDTFVLTTEADLSGTISGGPGDDTLVGADTANTWEVTGQDAGRLSDVEFSSVESLFGGAVEDAFVFGMVGRVSGLIDGRAGVDRVRGADKRNRWKLSGSGSPAPDDARLAGFEQIEGGSGEDELVGPDADATWTITGAGAGTVNGVSFSRMENLTGAADNEDTFVIEPGGSVSGLVEGGAAGFDTLEIADGGYSTIVSRPTGPDSGSIFLDGMVIQYAGLEPIDLDAGPNVSFDLTGIIGGNFTLDHDSGDTFKLVENNGGMESTTFTDPGAAGTVTINLGSGSDTITLKNLLGGGAGTTLNAAVIITGGAGDDTYVLDDTWGEDVTLVEAASEGDDTLDFDLFSGTITITPALSGDVTIDGSDGSSLTLSSSSAQNFEDLTNANIDLAGLTGSVEDELVGGLEALVTFARNVAAVGQFATTLPLLGKNAEVAAAKALGFAEALDELRLEVQEFFDGGVITTDALKQHLNTVFNGVLAKAVSHLGAAILSPLSIVDSDINALDQYEFELTIDSTTTVTIVVDVDAAVPTPQVSGTTVTVGLGGTLTVANLVQAINLALLELDETAGAIGAVARDGRLAFQVVSTEIDEFAVEGLAGAAITKLGFETGAAVLLQNVQDILRGLGNLELSVGNAVELVASFDNGTPQLRFGVDYHAARTSNFFYNLGDEAQSLGLAFDLQAQISATASLDFDFQLGLDVTASDVEFFLDVDELRAGILATVTAGTMVDLNIGFIGVTANVSASLDAGVEATLSDTLHISAATLLLDPVASGGLLFSAPPFTLTGANGSGTPTFGISLALAVDAGVNNLGGFTASATLSASGNPFDPLGSNIVITPGGDFTQFFDFNRMNAAGVVSLLGQLSSWLDGVRDGDAIDSLNIPFVEGALDKILDFAEVFSDALLFDEGPDDVRDGADKLVSDLNLALGEAGLDRLIRAQGNGTGITLVAIDPEVTEFTIALKAGIDPVDSLAFDGGGFAQLGLANGTSGGTPDAITGTPQSVFGKLTGRAAFTVTVKKGTETVADQKLVRVAVAATTDNTGIGDDVPKLLDAGNAPTFANAQEFANRLTQIIALGIVHYDVATKILTLPIQFTNVPLFDVELPTDFELDLSPIASVQSNTRLIIKASGGIDLTLGLDLSESPAGSNSSLGPGTLLDDLGVEILEAEAITADAVPVATQGQLSGDATFTITFNPTVTVTVPSLIGQPGGDINVTQRDGAQSETTIAVNPLNPLNMIASANDGNEIDGINGTVSSNDSVWVTIDGGQIWTQVVMPVPLDVVAVHGDPTIVFNKDGVAVFAHLVHETGTLGADNTHGGVGDNADGDHILAVAVAQMDPLTKTTGFNVLDWTAMKVTDAGDADKEFLAVGPDASTPSEDLFVIAWHDHNVIFASTWHFGDPEWTDPVIVGGIKTGTSAGELDAPPGGESIDSYPAFGPNGEIYVVWEDVGTPGVGRLLFDVSFDEGKTWGAGHDAKVFFGFNDQAVDQNEDEATLLQVVDHLNSNPQLVATVAGYTDTTDSPAANQIVSENRAQAVFQFLVDHGIAASRLTKVAFNETQLAVPTDDNVLEPQNRRVEITFDQVIYTGSINGFSDRALIVGATPTNTVEITTTQPHGLENGFRVLIDNVAGMTELNGRQFTITKTSNTTFTLNGENGLGRAPGVGGTFAQAGEIQTATAGNPAVITTQQAHNLVDGDIIDIFGMEGLLELNNRHFVVDVTGATTFELNTDGVNFSGTPHVLGTGAWAKTSAYSVPAQPLRGFSMQPNIEVDRSGGPNAARIYVSFTDQADFDNDNDRLNPVDHHDTDIYVIASDDLGVTWNALESSPGAIQFDQVRVNDDFTDASQFNAWIDIDQSTGNIALAWLDTRNDDGTGGAGDTDSVADNDVEYFVAISFDGGLTWTENQQVSDEPSSAVGTRAFNYGEYNGLVFLNNTLHLTWADTSDSTNDNPDGDKSFTDIYYDQIRLTNSSVSDLVDDINTALAEHATVPGALPTDPPVPFLGLDQKFQAFADGNVIKIHTIDPTITQFTLATTKLDPAFRDLGFPESAVGQPGGSLVVTALKGVPMIVGQLSADASFDLDLDGAGGNAPVTVTVLREDTVSPFAPNRNILDLVNDVQKAVNLALVDDVIEVSSAGGKLLFTRTGPTTDDLFTITPGSNADELGLTSPLLTSDEADLVITTRDGNFHRVVLDGFTTVGQVMDAINTLPGNPVTVAFTVDDPEGDPTPINEANTGLTLTDNTLVGSDEFTAAAANGSLAGLRLGILGTDTNPNDPDDEPDHTIVGAKIAGATLLDRFFITGTDLSEVITAELEVEAGVVVEDITVVSEDGTNTVITSSSFKFKAAHDELRLFIKDVNGFNAGEYEIDSVDTALNQVTIHKVGVAGVAGEQNQSGGLATLATGVQATASVGMIGIELGGTAELGAQLSLGFNTNAPELTDNKLTLQELVDGLDHILDLLGVPDLTPTNPPNFGTLTLDEVTISAGGAEFDAMDLLGSSAEVGITLVTVGDPFIGTRFERASYTQLSPTQFKVDGNFTGKLPNDVVLQFTVSTVSHELKVVSTSYNIPADETTVTVALADPADPAFPLPATLTGVDVVLVPKVTVQTPDFEDLLDFSDLTFADIIAALKALANFLGQFEAFGFLNTDLPIINKSVNDLLAFAEDFADAIEEAENNPAGTLQVLEDKLNEAMGLSGDRLDDIFAAVGLPDVPSLSDDVFDLAWDPDNDMLKLDFSLGTSFSQSLDVAIPGIDFGDALESLGLDLVDLQASAGLTAEGGVLLRLSLGVDVANFDISDPGASLFVLDTTGLDAKLTVAGEDLAFRVGIGPFALSVAESDVPLRPSEIKMEGEADLEFDPGLFDGDGRVSFNTLFGSLSLSNVDLTTTGTVSGELPVYFPTDSSFLGTIRIGGSTNAGAFTTPGDLLNLVSNPLPEIMTSDSQTLGANKIVIDVSDVVEGISNFDLSKLSLFDNIFLAIDGLDTALGFVQDLIGSKFAIDIPLIGDGLGKGAHFIGDLREDLIAPLRTAIEKAKDAAQDFADPDKNIISKALFDLLGPGGLDLLVLQTGTGDSAGDYILLDTNFDDYLFHPELNIQQKDVFIEWDLELGDSISEAADIGFDLGIPGLGLKTEGDITFNLDWLLRLGFGLSFTEGFYLKVDDAAPGPRPELIFDVGVTLPAAITGTLGFLGLRGEDTTIDGNSTELGATFVVDVFEKGASPGQDAERLAFTEFGQIGLNPGIAAEASASLHLELGLSADLFVELFGSGAANVISGFPKIVGDFVFLWSIGNRGGGPGDTPEQRYAASQFAALDPAANTLDGNLFTEGSIENAIADGLKLVEFRDINLDLGSFLSEVLGPIVEEVGKFTGPIQPLIDFITSPVPIIGQLGLDITWLDLAEQLSGGAIDVGLIKAVAEIITLINQIADLSSSGVVMLPIGGMKVFEDTGDPGTSFKPQLWNGSLDLNATFDSIQNAATGLLTELFGDNEISGALGELVGAAASTLKGVVDKETAGGFKFPFLDDPTQIFGMLMGKPADLVTYDLAPLVFGFDFHQFFSIFGPLGVSIGLLVEFTINTAFGYDTQGIQDFVATGFQNPLLLFNGFFIDDSPNQDGNDDPELTFLAELQAAAELNLGIARAGVAAAFGFEILFDLFDPNDDGKIRITELIGNFVNQLNAPSDAEKLLAPLAIFDVTGEIFARLFAFLEIDFGFFTFEKEFPIFGPVTLLSFEVDFFRPPILASELDNGDLLIHTGEFAKQRLLGNATDIGEHLVISSDGTDGSFVNVVIHAPGGNLGEDSEAAQHYQVAKGRRIIIDGGEGDDTFDLTSFTEDGVLVDIELGVGNDEVKFNDSAGGVAGKFSIIHGGSGDDTIDGTGGSDLIFGEAGNDGITAGDGADLVFADEGEIGTDTARALIRPTDGGDTVDAGGGEDIVFGSGGTDILDGGTGPDGNLVIGGGGLVFFTSGSAFKVFDSVKSLQGGGVTETQNLVFDPTASDTITGSDGADILVGTGGPDVILGLGGADTIFGQAGVDTIDAGDGDDIVFGDGGQITADGPVPTSGGDKDDIQGGSGADTIFGGGGNDLIQGGADDDHIFGGSGADLIFGDNGHVTGGVVILDPGTGDDKISGEGEPDKIYGGPGIDEIDGGVGSDLIKGGDDPDAIFSNKGSDILDGQEGSDGYLIQFQGGTNANFVKVFDSGVTPGDIDLFVATGTLNDDNILLRSNTDGSVAFVALINGPDHVERIEYNSTVERIVVNGSFGEDYFASDDTAAEVTLNGEFGDDTFQIGQMFKSERTEVDANVAVDDVFATIETTRGFLSNGISKPMTINGGLGNDHFTVFHNKAVLQLNGEEGDDLFEIRAFALAGSQEPQRERTDISGGAGADLVQYVVNAPVNIDGGDGFDTVVVIGTEFGDDFVITRNGVFGAGLNVNFVNIEALRVDGAEGNDRFFVESTSEDFVTEIFGGLGEDTFNMSGAVPPVVSNDLRGHSGIIVHEVESGDDRFDGQQLFGVSANVADNDEPFIVIRETEGSTIITEGGSLVDQYTLVLTRQPDTDVFVKALAPIPTPSSREQRALPFRLSSPTADSVTADGSGLSLRFTTANWYIPQTVTVTADAAALSDIFGLFTRPELGDNGGVLPVPFDMDDEAYEGVRFGVVNHLIQAAAQIVQGLLKSVTNGSLLPLLPTTVTVDEPVGLNPQDLFGRKLLIIEGKGIGQSRFIFGAVDDGTTWTLTLDRPFLGADVPDLASKFFITIDDAIVGKMTGFVEEAFGPDDPRSTFSDNTAPFPTVGEGLRGAVLEIIGGPGAGQQRLILENDTDTLTLNGGWRTNPVAGQSIYRILRYEGLAIPSVTVQVNDDDRPGLVVDETKGFDGEGDNDAELVEVVPDIDTITAVIEAGDGDFRGELDVIRVRLSTDPGVGNEVEVGLNYDHSQFLLKDLDDDIIDAANPLAFDDTNWDDFQHLVVYGVGDGLREGFHSSLIEFEILGDSFPDVTVQDHTDPFEPITQERAVFFVGLTHVPLDGTVQVTLNLVNLVEGTTFDVFSNKVVFTDAVSGEPIALAGDISVTYDYTQRGFDTAFTKPILARISDVDAPTVLVRETDGSTDVIEVKKALIPIVPEDIPFFFNTSGSPWTDSYELVLTGAPALGETVTITVTPEITKTTRTGGIRHDAIQVAISSSDPRAQLVGGNLVITFDETNWDEPLVVNVTAVDDTVVDGSDTQVFAPHPNTVSGILGPVVVEGAGGRGTLALNAPLMLPGETNLRKADGDVVAFTANPSSEPGAIEQMLVNTQDLEDKIAELELDSIDDLKGLTIEMARGQGVGVVLDPTRPRELFDRFWLINEVQDVDGEPEHKRLILQNPSQLNVAALDPSAIPNDESEYAITTLSANFFVDEKTQVDFMFVHDEDSPADHTGFLTPNRLYGLNMGPDLVIGGAVRLGGITYGDLEVLEINLGTGNNNFTVLGTPIREDGYQTWTFLNTGDDIIWNGVQGDTVTVKLNKEDEVVTTDVATTGSNPDGITTFTTTVTIPGIFADGALEGFVINILDDDLGENDAEADGQVRRIITNVGGLLTVDRPWEFIPNGEAFEIVNEADGAFAVNLQGGDDTLDASASSLGIVAFGGLGEDTMTGGSGDDIIFGDRGRVDYFNEIDAIVTRLGDAPEPITGFVTTQVTDTEPSVRTIVDSGASFAVPDDILGDGLGTDDIGLRGLYVDINDGFGFLQSIRLIDDNTANTLTLVDPFDTELDLPGPVVGDESKYRISTRPEDQTDGVVRDPFLLITVDSGLGDVDAIDAGGGNDQVFGGAGGDDIMGGDDDDVVIGDAGRIQRSRDLDAPETPGFGDVVASVFETLNLIDFTVGGADTLQGGADDDVLIGGAFGDSIDGDSGNDLIFGDTVQLLWRIDDTTGVTDITDPRFQTLLGTQIYDTPATNAAGADQVSPNPTSTGRDYRNPDGSVPTWAPWQIQNLYHTEVLALAPDDSFGNDYIAGGTHHDVIFGQLGDDTIQGDGSIEFASTGNYAAIGTQVGAARDGSNALLLNPSFEDADDGDDYIEGNGGNDVVFGGLGQDDIIGGSSDLFTLETYGLITNERPDGSDLLFGGSGERAGRHAAVNGPNDVGPDDTFFAERHGRDADVILGDNGDIFRLVGINQADTGFLAFNYDVNGLAAEGYSASARILPRAVRLLDYTPGGSDFTTAVEPADVALNPTSSLFDIGAGDEVHGESGDDFIYGQVRNDVLFGDGQDDAIVGGYGDDWISGGTGDDGILGDDGRIYASRNSTSGEPLYGIAAIAAADINKLIQTQSGDLVAITNVSGLLKYTPDLTPQNLDPNQASPNVLFRPVYADDIIYGGGGNDSIHSGAGDDATSGAEAPAVSYTNNYDQNGVKLNGAPLQSDFFHPFNPGNVLGYAPTGPNATKFALYDAADTLRKILLTATGALSKTGTGLEWILNFDHTEGPIDTKWIVGQSTYPGVATDGDDHVFADLGNDWTVGGTGRDVVYSGWGDDLANMDDVLTTAGGLNNVPETNPSWEDLAYGGAGLDVLIANTGGDRLIDWVGEFNTYRVPWSNFGEPQVIRRLLPGLPQFLYALSKSEGADQTLAAQYGGAAARNGEPFGELGLVLQQDAAWNDQIGPPRDAQAGNTNANLDVKVSAGTLPLYETAAGSAPTITGTSGLLTDSQLAPIVAEAKLLWTQALGAGDSRLAGLDGVQIMVGNLPDDRLGVTIGDLILIDSGAAGRGWFIDPTPWESQEFLGHRSSSGGLGATASSPASGRMDLLTTVMHELGNALGFREVGTPGNVMAETLALGVRGLDFDSLTARGLEVEPVMATGSTNGLARGLDMHSVPADGAPRPNGVRSIVDWDAVVGDLLGSLSPYGGGPQKSALKPLFPAFEYAGAEDWDARRHAWARRGGEERVDTAEHATLLPSTGWDWQVEVAATTRSEEAQVS